MKRPPADWRPLPQGYREAAEAAWRAWHEERAAKRNEVAGAAPYRAVTLPSNCI